ncbi:MAG TPA: MATE family efflux transporter, partial [Polyangiaceae bacterium]|nr:MATE family efflux transporter [Polyangiaceae bacterium]
MTSLLQTLVFLVDRVLLGRYSQDALASMQVQGPLVWSLFSVLSGAVVGVVPLVARHVGARDQQQARDVVLAGLLLAAGLGVGLGIAVAVFLKPIVQVLGPESEGVRGLSEQYLSVVVWALPSMFVATTAALCLSAAGNTRTPFLVGVVSNGLNVLVSY